MPARRMQWSRAQCAYQIWKNAGDIDPKLRKLIPDLADVVFSTKSISAIAPRPAGAPSSIKPTAGVMVYVRTADGNDALAWVDEQGRTVTESQHEILRAAACEPSTPALPRLAAHHTLVAQAVTGIQRDHQSTGGQLGKPSSARRRTYERLKDYAADVKGTLFDLKLLHQAIDAIFESPLTEAARDLLNRELRAGVESEKLAELVNPHVAAFPLVARAVDNHLQTLPGPPLGMFIADENKDVVRDVEKAHKLLRGADGVLKLVRIVEKGFFIDSAASLPLQLCDLCVYAARRKEEQKAGLTVKPLDASAIAHLDPLILRTEESFPDVLAWLTEQQKKDAAKEQSRGNGKGPNLTGRT